MSPLGESKGSWHCEKEPADRSATGSTDKAVEATILAAFSSLVPTGESPMFLWTRSATCCPYGGLRTLYDGCGRRVVSRASEALSGAAKPLNSYAIKQRDGGEFPHPQGPNVFCLPNIKKANRPATLQKLLSSNLICNLI